jgi:hypothetical protein
MVGGPKLGFVAAAFAAGALLLAELAARAIDAFGKKQTANESLGAPVVISVEQAKT